VRVGSVVLEPKADDAGADRPRSLDLEVAFRDADERRRATTRPASAGGQDDRCRKQRKERTGRTPTL
jgi:hypothetical protein